MILPVLRRVFYEGRYVTFAAVVALLVVSAMLLLPNLSVIVQVFGVSTLSFWEKMSFVLSLYGTIETNFTLFSAVNLILLAVLSGVNLALLRYYIKRQQVVTKNAKLHVVSIGGILSGFFGVGCAACGSVIATALLSSLGAGWLIALLPLHGVEFGIVGVILLLVSIRYLIKKISDPLTCRVD